MRLSTRSTSPASTSAVISPRRRSPGTISPPRLTAAARGPAPAPAWPRGRLGEPPSPVAPPSLLSQGGAAPLGLPHCCPPLAWGPPPASPSPSPPATHGLSPARAFGPGRRALDRRAWPSGHG